MKRIFIALTVSAFFLAFLGMPAFAAMPPWPAFCEHQGYQYIIDYDAEPRTESCVFDDGNQCDAHAFLEGTCGKEYVKEIACRQKGEYVFDDFEQCCEGLQPEELKFPGQPTCVEPPNFLQQFWEWILSLFGL